MPDAERMTLSSQISPGYGKIYQPRRKYSTGSIIATILILKAGGLIITIFLAAVVILSQTHPEIINLRPLIEGNIRNNPPASESSSMALLPTIVQLTEAAIKSTSNAQAATKTSLQTAVVVLPSSTLLPSLTLSPIDTETASITPTLNPTGTKTLNPTATSTLNPTSTATLKPTTTLTPTITKTFTPTVTLYPFSLTAYSSQMSTPLLGIGFGELHTIISQPYSVPDVHSDAGHHGVDLGSYDYHGKLIYDWPILSVFSGKVAGVVNNRYPIGNCIILETAYTQLPDEIISETGINSTQSLYTMYCHMIDPPNQQIGDVVNVAQEIGRVGKSQTVEAHLHLEMVIGPPNQVIPSMAYYNGDATEDEKKVYLWWRTSGTFTSFNPMTIIANLK